MVVLTQQLSPYYPINIWSLFTLSELNVTVYVTCLGNLILRVVTLTLVIFAKELSNYSCKTKLSSSFCKMHCLITSDIIAFPSELRTLVHFTNISLILGRP